MVNPSLADPPLGTTAVGSGDTEGIAAVSEEWVELGTRWVELDVVWLLVMVVTVVVVVSPATVGVLECGTAS